MSGIHIETRTIPFIETLQSENLIEAAEQMLQESVLCWGAWDKLEVEHLEDSVITRSPIDFPFFNNVMSAVISSQSAAARIKELNEQVGGNEKGVCWWLGQGNRPDNLAALLENAGAFKVMENCLMAVELDQLPEVDIPEGIEVVEVISNEQLAQWNSVVCPAHEIPADIQPHWREMYAAAGYGPESKVTRHFLALQNGKAVGATSLITAAGVASVANVATDKAYRQRGIGSLLNFWPLKVAEQCGYKVACLSASPGGVPVYAKLGFEELATSSAYLWMPQPAA